MSVDPSIRRGTLVPVTPGLSICILVLEHAALVLDCLDALRRPGGCPPGTEVVVVANGTPPEQLDSLAGHDDVVLVVNQVNLGFRAGCNQAASVARAPLLVFLNDDSTVEDGCIDALIRTASYDPEIGAVGSRIIAVDGTLQEAGSVLWRDGSAAHVGEGLPPGSDAYLEPRDVDYASANGLLVTRRAWNIVGGFDERFYSCLLRGRRPVPGSGRSWLPDPLRAAGPGHPPGKPEHVERLPRISPGPEPAAAGRKVGPGARPIRPAARQGHRAHVRGRRAAGVIDAASHQPASDAEAAFGATVDHRTLPCPPTRFERPKLARRVPVLPRATCGRRRSTGDLTRDLPLGTLGSPPPPLGGGMPRPPAELTLST